MRLFFVPLFCGLAFAQPPGRSPEYDAAQHRLARGWNTWDVHSVAEQVLLPEGLAIKFGIQHRSTLTGETFLSDALIGRLGANAFLGWQLYGPAALVAE